MMATKTVVHVADLAASQPTLSNASREWLQPSKLGVYGRFSLSRC